jgi:dienelactone hydrolase
MNGVALSLTLAALAPSIGPAAALELAEFRALATEFVRERRAPEHEAIRRKLAPFESMPVRTLEQEIQKGLAYRARSEKEALRPDETGDRLTLTDGFAVEVGDRRWTYAVWLPPGYDPSKRHPLLFDPGHGAMTTREERLQQGQSGVYLRALQGKGVIFARSNVILECGTEAEYASLLREHGSGWLAARFDACVRDAVSRFAVDPDRVYVVGVSQTAYWAWQIATDAPWRYAAVAPLMGVLNDARGAITNCLGLPFYVATGEKDTIVTPEQGRSAASTLKRLGSEVEYVEVEGGDHGAWIPQCDPAIRWMLARRRAATPKSFSLVIHAPLPRHGAFVRVDEIDAANRPADRLRPAALLEASVDGQTVRVRSDDVTRFTLYLSDALVDLDRPVTVEWNGRRMHEGPLARRLEVLLDAMAERLDTSRTFTAAIEIR